MWVGGWGWVPVILLTKTPLTWRSCLAASALARLLKVTKPTGEAVLPFLLVTFRRDPS